MLTQIAMCGASQCNYNDKGLCTLPHITIDENAHCDHAEIQLPLPESAK